MIFQTLMQEQTIAGILSFVMWGWGGGGLQQAPQTQLGISELGLLKRRAFGRRKKVQKDMQVIPLC